MVISTEHRTMNRSKRNKSEPVLYSAETRCSLLSELPDCDSHCQPACNGIDAHTFHVDAANCTASDECFDNTQYVALDCEFVGVGPRLLSALGMFASDDF